MQKTLAVMMDETIAAGISASVIREIVKDDEDELDYSLEEEQEYIKKGKGWEEFVCRCGAKVQLSPTFIGKFITCRKCKRRIKINLKKEGD